MHSTMLHLKNQNARVFIILKTFFKGFSIFHSFPVLVQFWGRIGNHGKVLRNDHVCSESWLLTQILVVASPRPPLNMGWHETLREGRGHVHRRQP